jgi:hypothetical protein
VAISAAVQHNGRVDVYNEKNKLVGSHLGKPVSTSRSITRASAPVDVPFLCHGLLVNS